MRIVNNYLNEITNTYKYLKKLSKLLKIVINVLKLNVLIYLNVNVYHNIRLFKIALKIRNQILVLLMVK